MAELAVREPGVAAPAGAAEGGLAAALPWLVAAVLYLVVMAVGSSLLNDADTLWHLTVGEWIAANGLPHVDPFSYTAHGHPWIAKEWLSQLAMVGAYRLGGWSGLVVLTASALALAFGLLTRFLVRVVTPTAALAMVAAVFLLVAPHALARPHVLALPLLVVWTAGLVRAVDDERAPSPWLLPLMIVWANLHGGFILGLGMIVALGLDAIASATAERRSAVIRAWALFAVFAFAAACVTPYGPEGILTAWRIVTMGPALSLISEWQPPSFASLGGFELVLLGAIGFVLYRGLTLPPIRILIVLALLHLALSAERNAEVFAFLVPMLVATPLARQHPSMAAGTTNAGNRAWPAALVILALMVPLTWGFARLVDYRPNPNVTPEAAVAALAEATSAPVLNDYNFGGYLIRAGIPTFIDGRTELYGGAFLARYYRAVALADVGALKALLADYDIGATLLSPALPAVAYLDADPAWKRIYADDVAVVHVRATP